MKFMLKAIPFLLLILVFWYVGLFAFYNQGYVALEAPYFGNYQMAVTLAMLTSFIAGAGLALAYFGFDSFAKSRKIKKLQKQQGALATTPAHHAESATIETTEL